MLRTSFLERALALATLSAMPQPSPAPSATGSGECDTNSALPYDRPLEMKLSALDGPEFDLMKYRGFAVWINVFATWCGPCNYEQPSIVSLAEKYHERGLRVIGVFDREEDNTVRAYRKKYGITYPLARDRYGIMTHNLEGSATSTAYPSHLFLTSWGSLYRYRASAIGPSEMQRKIEKILTTVKLPPPADP